MRKYSFILSAVAVTGLTVSAFGAAESTYWFDVRPTAASITTPAAPFTFGQGDFPDDGGAGGGRGNGQVLRICPTVSNGYHNSPTGAGPSYPNFDADGNSATGDLWLYCDVLPNADSPLGTNDVISSIGLDMAISTSAATPRFDIATVAWSWTYVDNGGNANFGTANGTSSRTGVVGAKYVKVPVAGTPAVYASAGGLVVGGPYQLGKLAIGAAGRGLVSCTTATTTHATNSTYTVNMSINNLLITRTFSTGGNATPEERVSLGYTGGALEADVSGNAVGGAGVRDAVIQVRMKDDSNGSGHVTSLDISGFTTAQNKVPNTSINQRERYLFDRNNNGTVTSLDISGFTGAQNAPCP